MTDEIEWPREIWLAALDQHHNGQAHAVLSEHATVPRWEGDKERDREFHKYVDADIYDSAEKYQAERLRIALERAEKAENELALVTAQLEAAQEAFPAQPGLMRQRMAERAGSPQQGAEQLGDTRCQECCCENVNWFAPNDLWNSVMGGADATDDPGGVLCPTCFIRRAGGDGAWRVMPAEPGQTKRETET
ncbi:hypothetical protein KPG71_18940 [Roseovarius sp. PS-C2]|uniref:hypothetical protein n=1 Tax=Roseovarius sp. PS-C2 TaxID=2820814 RepID=UPI001C0B34D1|nr:hypothetical protein [Roseovarius sp. PS-C2]MBU3262103.1 hypothetical protein [Roseovarius sp. PS-C2]